MPGHEAAVDPVAEPSSGSDTDPLDRFLVASRSADIHGLAATLAPDAELVSPLSGRLTFRGRRDVAVLLRAVYTSMSGLQWTQQVGTGGTRVVMGEAKVGPLRITEAMVFDLARDGRISRIRPHLRPWLAVTLLALRLVATLAPYPGIIARAARSA